MFCDTLKLLVETPDHPFIEAVDLKFILRFLKIVAYQGIIDKTKINILQIFHAVINCVHVDYVKLLWRDFIHCVQQKKDVIQYPYFTKLIIADLMKKFPFISQRLEENYHSIKDDIPLESVYTTGNVTIRGMLIPAEFLTNDICATPEYKKMGRNLSSKAVARETSSPSKSLKVNIKQKKPCTTSISLPSYDRERDEIHEATQLSIIIHKTIIIAEAQENVAIVQEKNLEEDIEKMVDVEDEESYASAFVDSVFQDDEDAITRIEPESHKENPENVDDDVNKNKKDDEKDNDDDNDDNDNHDNHAIDKTIHKELTNNFSPIPSTTSKDQSMSKPTSNTRKILLGSVAEMSRRCGQLKEQMTNTFVTKDYFEGKMKEMFDNLNNIVPDLTVAKTNELIKEAVLRMVNDAVKQDKELFAGVVPELVSKEFDIRAPKIIKELFKFHMKHKAQAVVPEIWDVLKKKYEKSSTSASSGKGHDVHQDKR
uniref:Uncharacterized protein n=1 Tax=Tanacetum cinerariifolium TaxID=118510 RepID=A0A699GKN8_TANCI|nr:hypothetical protein [Tanacetum cinerariifolium]